MMNSSGWCSDLEKKARIGSLVMFQIKLMSKVGDAHLNMLFSRISLRRCCMSSLKNQNITDAQDHKDSPVNRCMHYVPIF